MVDTAAGRRIADRYVLGEEIGHGGRAVVHAARDGLLGREVAVKLFRSDVSRAGELKVQEDEARLAARMNHHALTTLFDAGVDSGDPARPRLYLVMERIPGMDLKQRLRRHGPLTIGQAACLGLDLSEALQVVHEHGFLHRDIKPANVLIADRDLTTRIRGKLTDFGISSIIGLPEEGPEVTGTAAYLSPEQVEGRGASTASDVYSLGLVLLEALTGQVAFPGGIEESAFARLDRDPRLPASIPDPIAGILREMTRLRPEDRPSLPEVTAAFMTAYVQHLFEVGRVDLGLLVNEEQSRVAAVREYRILDTPPDDAFDRITKLACRLLDVPVGLVAIIDAERLWFKSQRGIRFDSVDRNIALSSTTLATGRPVQFDDVQTEPAARGNPLAEQNPDLHAYAAVPLTTNDGHVIGTLSVLDRRIRRFTPDEIDDLTDLAAIAVRELDLRLAVRRAVLV